MNSIKFIYFDVGGVILTDTGLKDLCLETGVDFNVCNNTFSKYGHQACQGKYTFNQLWEFSLNKLQISSEIVDIVPKIVSYAKPILETHQLILDLKDKFPLGLLTNIPKDFPTPERQPGLFPDHKFDVVIRSADIGMAKPDLEIYHYSQHQVKLRPEEIFFTDDSFNNIQAAKKIGWQTFHFDRNNPKQSVTSIRKLFDLSNN